MGALAKLCKSQLYVRADLIRADQTAAVSTARLDSQLLAGFNIDFGCQEQQGSSANRFPETAYARALEPPQTSRNSQTPHFP